MTPQFFLHLLAHAFLLVLFLALLILPARLRMVRRARQLLAQHPNAEQTSLYLQFHSIKPSKRQQAIQSTIADMAAKGWTYLRATEASPLRTVLTWAGGINLHFIRASSTTGF